MRFLFLAAYFAATLLHDAWRAFALLCRPVYTISQRHNLSFISKLNCFLFLGFRILDILTFLLSRVYLNIGLRSNSQIPLGF